MRMDKLEISAETKRIIRREARRKGNLVFGGMI